MKLAACLVLFLSTCVVWAQDAAPADAAPADQPAADAVPPAPWKFSLDVGVRASVLIPALNSAQTFSTGGAAGAELSVPLPEKTWHVRAGVDTGSITAGGVQYYLTTVRPGLCYDAFFGPTAFMSFEAEGGWLVATSPNFTYVDGKPCAGAGTSLSFFWGDHVNFRTDLRWLEVFNTVHLVTLSVGFDVIGN